MSKRPYHRRPWPGRTPADVVERDKLRRYRIDRRSVRKGRYVRLVAKMTRTAHRVLAAHHVPARDFDRYDVLRLWVDYRRYKAVRDVASYLRSDVALAYFEMPLTDEEARNSFFGSLSNFS